jgi:hypothetical protein
VRTVDGSSPSLGASVESTRERRENGMPNNIGETSREREREEEKFQETRTDKNRKQLGFRRKGETFP